MKKQISIVYKRGLLWKHQQQSYYLKLISLDNRQKINTNVVWHQTFHQSFKLKTGKNIWCSVESNSNQIEYWTLDHLPNVTCKTQFGSRSDSWKKNPELEPKDVWVQLISKFWNRKYDPKFSNSSISGVI